MIDLHFHILPGIDDGPPDLSESLELARAAQADGIQIVAATPHLRDDHPLVRPEELAERCSRVNEALAEARIALEVLPAGELDVLWVHGATPKQLRLASYGQRGTDLLLETPYGALGPAFDAALERAWSLGYRVLLAHPERNREFQRSPMRLAELVARGVLIQVSAGSLTDRPRSLARALALQLVERRLAHVIASDAHAATRMRPPNLAAGVAAASAIDPVLARWMVVDAPLAILSGTSLPPLGAKERPRRA